MWTLGLNDGNVQITFVVSYQKKTKKKKRKKTRFVLKSQSCNYLKKHLKCYSGKPSFPLAFHRVNQMSFRSTYVCPGQVMLAHTK